MSTDIPIKATETSFAIIKSISNQDRPRFLDVVGDLEMPKSTVHDYLKSLETLGYVVKVEDRYRLSSRFLELGVVTREGLEFYKLAAPHMEKLAEETGERLSLVVEENGLGVLLYGAKSSPEDDLPLPGTHTRLHASASGKVIMSAIPEDEVVEIVDRYGLPKFTGNTITDLDALLEERAEIRETGHAFDRQERVTGLHGVAAPLQGPNGERAAIALYGPATRVDGTRYTEEFPAKLKEVANIVEVNSNFP